MIAGYFNDYMIKYKTNNLNKETYKVKTWQQSTSHPTDMK